MARTISLHPVSNPLLMYKIHRYFAELELNKTFVETRTLQNAIKDMLPYLPEGKLSIKICVPGKLNDLNTVMKILLQVICK